jgi:cell division ATPase FtsA
MPTLNWIGKAATGNHSLMDVLRSISTAALQAEDMLELPLEIGERKMEGAFSLQTSRGRFSPDFVVKLKGGKIIVLEYKGAQLVDKKSEVKKSDIGELLEKRSNQACGFGMIADRDWASLDGKLAGNRT